MTSAIKRGQKSAVSIVRTVEIAQKEQMARMRQLMQAVLARLQSRTGAKERDFTARKLQLRSQLGVLATEPVNEVFGDSETFARAAEEYLESETEKSLLSLEQIVASLLKVSKKKEKSFLPENIPNKNALRKLCDRFIEFLRSLLGGEKIKNKKSLDDALKKCQAIQEQIQKQPDLAALQELKEQIKKLRDEDHGVIDANIYLFVNEIKELELRFVFSEIDQMEREWKSNHSLIPAKKFDQLIRALEEDFSGVSQEVRKSIQDKKNLLQRIYDAMQSSVRERFLFIDLLREIYQDPEEALYWFLSRGGSSDGLEREKIVQNFVDLQIFMFDLKSVLLGLQEMQKTPRTRKEIETAIKKMESQLEDVLKRKKSLSEDLKEMELKQLELSKEVYSLQGQFLEEQEDVRKLDPQMKFVRSAVNENLSEEEEALARSTADLVMLRKTKMLRLDKLAETDGKIKAIETKLKDLENSKRQLTNFLSKFTAEEETLQKRLESRWTTLLTFYQLPLR